MVFNRGMNTEIDVIQMLGGPKRVAELLGIASEPGAIQRVGNWKRRGIPASVLIANPDFHRRVKRVERQAREATHA